jgi:hypothetical protein
MTAQQVCILLICVAMAAPAAAQQCLHGSSSTPEQQSRKRAALSAARQVNTLQANGSVARQGKYLTRIEMGELYAEQLKKRPALTPLVFDRSSDIMPGWQLTFDLTESGYWFMIRDTTDPCGFAFVSSQNGVIYTAEPIR